MLQRNSSKRELLRSKSANKSANVFPPLSQERFLEAKRIFSKFDEANAGSITQDQLILALIEFGLTRESAKDSVGIFSVDIKNRISFSEFMNQLPLIEHQKSITIRELISSQMPMKVHSKSFSQ